MSLIKNLKQKNLRKGTKLARREEDPLQVVGVRKVKGDMPIANDNDLTLRIFVTSRVYMTNPCAAKQGRGLGTTVLDHQQDSR